MRSMFSLALSVWLLGSWAIAAEPGGEENDVTKPIEPLKLIDGATTSADFRREVAEFLAHDAELYQQHSKDPEKIKKLADDFFRQVNTLWIERHLFGPPIVDWSRLSPLAITLARSSRDPVLLSYCGEVLLCDQKVREARKPFTLAVQNFEASPYPRWMLFPILMRQHPLTLMVSNSGIVETRQKLRDVAPDWLARATDEPQYRRLIWEFYVEADNMYYGLQSSDAAAIAGVLGKREDKDPWMWEMVQGKRERDIAWQHRGSGSNDRLSDAQRKNFSEHLTRAGEHFQQAHQLHPEIPDAAARMIEVAMGNGDKEAMQTWFERSIAAQCDYPYAYRAMLLGLRPGWHGSHEAMMAFGERCARTGRFDTMIPYVYVQALLNIEDESSWSWSGLLSQPRVYDKMAYVLEQLADHPSRAGQDGQKGSEQVELMARHLVIALEGDRYADVCRLADSLGDRLKQRHFNSRDVSAGFEVSRMYAMRDFGDELALILRENPTPRVDPKLAEQLLERLEPLVQRNREPKAQLFFETRQRWARQELAYHRGEWVDLTFDEALSDWAGELKGWTYEDSQSVRGSNLDGAHFLALYHRGQFPGPREVECEVEVLQYVNTSVQDGCIIGRRSSGAALYWVGPAFNQAGITSIGRRTWNGTINTLQKVNKLRARHWGSGYNQLFVNGMYRGGEFKSEKFELRNGITAKNQVGIGADSYGAAHVVRIRNVRVRKLTAPPPPKQSDGYDKRIEYYTAAIAAEPEMLAYRHLRGQTLYYSRRYEEAVEDLAKYLSQDPPDYFAHMDLGICYSELSRYREALEHFKKGHLMSSKYLEFRMVTAKLIECLATAPDDSVRDGQRAVKLASNLCERTKRTDFDCLFLLALAQAETGAFDVALKTLDEAEGVASEKDKDSSDFERLGELRKKFKAGQPERFVPRRR